ncbi:MAG: hypothetical protein RLN79_04820 [Cytophagales bacterium]
MDVKRANQKLAFVFVSKHTSMLKHGRIFICRTAPKEIDGVNLDLVVLILFFN